MTRVHENAWSVGMPLAKESKAHTAINRLSRQIFHATKEAMDPLLAGVAFVLALPVLAIAAMIIKFSSRGPLIYTQVRVGKDGTQFKMYKLRTMFINAESCTGPVWATKDDPRVIPSCRWMRRSHVDELPQLFNVMRGEMSLVGPRPERPEITEQLELIFHDYRHRLTVKPGITGLAQVRHGYCAGIGSIRAKLTSDLEYIERANWLMELGILARTITALNDKGAH